MGSVDLIRASLPCSVELPAGCGKTHIIAQLVHAVAEDGGRTLVLTHTHAGVDALRRRFRRLGVRSGSVTVRTIDSWCFDLIRSFPRLAGIVVGEEPDWRESRSYHDAGKVAAASEAIRRMLSVSYELFVVDEYQDCQQWQHGLVRAVADVVPTCVLGDRMQGLFFFSDNNPVIWEEDVIPSFPSVDLPIHFWRWHQRNESLGEWLLDTRSRLLAGDAIDLSGGPLQVYTHADLIVACHAQPKHPERVVAIGRWPGDCAILARRLGGGYTMIEEMEGRHLLAFADIVDEGDCSTISAEVIDFAISCAFGVAAFFSASDRGRLRAGNALKLSKYSDTPLRIAAILNALFTDCSTAKIRSALKMISQLPSFRLYRREAWYGVLDSLRLASITPALSMRTAVVRVRNQLRLTGRYPESRILARPLLIKGLEFDHVLVSDASSYNAHELYVCLTRGSSSLTVVTNKVSLSPGRPY